MAQSFQDTLDNIVVNPEGSTYDTKMTLAPPDTVSKATVDGARLIVYPDKNNPGEHRAMVEYVFVLNDKELRDELNLEEPRAQYLLGLDTVKGWDGQGAPPIRPPGKNVNIYLGRWLDAFKMNNGKNFDLLTSFIHEDCFVRIGRPRGEDDRYANVMWVAATEEGAQPLRRGSR